MKEHNLTHRQVDDIILRKLSGETDESIAKLYQVTGRSIGNWCRSDRFVDRKKEIATGLRTMLLQGKTAHRDDIPF